MGLINDQMKRPSMEMEEGAESKQYEANETEQHEAEEGEQPGDPAQFQKAMDVAREGLYKNGAAESVLETVRRASSAAQGAADAAYNITSIADEMSGGIPPDYLVLVATSVLEEVADIAEAGGVPLKNSELAEAVKMMILRFVEESGQDASQLRQAMEQMNTGALDDPEVDSKLSQEEA